LKTEREEADASHWFLNETLVSMAMTGHWCSWLHFWYETPQKGFFIPI